LTMAGSLGLIVLIRIDSHFDTPMYFFLLHLSFTDLCYVSVIAPKMLVNFLVDHKSISYTGCVVQLCLLTAFGTNECFILAVMAIDRYMAICYPLLYPVFMSQELCKCLIAGSYAAGVANAVLQTVYIFRLSYCRCNILKHFFCDIPKLLQLSCSESHLSESMNAKNETQVTQFIFSGLTDYPQLQVVLFALFLIIYIITLSANLGMILLIKIDPQLNTPMYFFLSHLSFLDASYSSTVTPKAMAGFFAKKKSISLIECAIQFYMFDGLVMTELFLLSVMAYDRYVAICNPLLYSVVMSKKLCTVLVTSVYIYGFVSSVVQTALTFTLSFCSSNMIDHFYCNDPPLLALSCSDTRPKEIQLLVLSGINLSSSLFTIIVSYVYILCTIFGKCSSGRRNRAFSTCASHLTAVIIFYGTLFFMYLKPSSTHSLSYDKVVSVFYAVVIPMLNPLIYSLRNKEVKEALKKVMGRKCFFNNEMPC
ncbi:olfactory receptor 1020-like, partial [Protobothrops mucrosquamatus]|uniref:olfactory receptor 1020-like n=1 Tax=Protobothrops mucrosquamatus TaxID=103944 RepID=UPI0010FB70FF